MRSNKGRSMLTRISLGAAVAVAVVMWSSAPAFAHNYLVGSSPTADSVVTEQPGQISVTTNDNLLDLDGSGSGMAMQISGPGTEKPLYYGDGCITVFGPTAETTAQLGQPGEYTVVWQVVSTDGHPVSGTFTFTWQPAAGQVLADGSPTAPTCGREEAAAPDSSPATTSSTPDSGQLTDGLWIGGAALAAILAAGVTLLVTTRRRASEGPGRSSGPVPPDDPGRPTD